jgi:hypothetical protein
VEYLFYLNNKGWWKKIRNDHKNFNKRLKTSWNLLFLDKKANMAILNKIGTNQNKINFLEYFILLNIFSIVLNSNVISLEV